VDAGDGGFDVLLQHLGQGLERGLAPLRHLVAISDEDDVALRQALLGGQTLPRSESRVTLPELCQDGAEAL